MVDDVSAAEQSAGYGSGWSHDWYSYDNYRTLHDSYIDRLTDQGIILDSRLSFGEIYVAAIMLKKVLREHEDQQGSPIPLHPQIYQQMGISPQEDW